MDKPKLNYDFRPYPQEWIDQKLEEMKAGNVEYIYETKDAYIGFPRKLSMEEEILIGGTLIWQLNPEKK